MTNSTASKIIVDLVVTYLTAMFLPTTAGNVEHARIAAAASVNAYGARDPADLIPIAQIIALGLAMLDSLDRSMEENLPVSLVLRLRGNAVSLGRLAEQYRRALPTTDTPSHRTSTIDPETERRTEEKTLASLARTEQRLARVQASHAAPPPSPKPAPQPDTDKAIWAAAMTHVAREFTADLDTLSPAERQDATNRAAILGSVADRLLSGQPLPPTIFTRNAQA
jgi:hypothetical protein